MLGTKVIAGFVMTLHKIENYIVTVQLEGEKKRQRILVLTQDGYGFKFKGTTWLIDYDFNLILDENGNAKAIKKELLPFFVYGTLRQEMWNHRVVGHMVKRIVPAMTNGIMYHNGSYPYIIEGQGTVHGELLYIQDKEYRRALKALDGLEGFRGEGSEYNHYDRKIITVKLKSGEEVQAYAYFANTRDYKSPKVWAERRRLTRIIDGDFVRWANDDRYSFAYRR